MRTIFSISLALLLVSAPAFAQGAGGSAPGAAGQALKNSLGKNTTAGPGAIQKDFLSNLKGGLSDKLGKKAGGKLFDNLQNESLSSNDVQKLMNGNTTKSQMKNWFGANNRQIDKVEKSVDGAVDQKNRSGFFGILIIVMVGDFGVDPSADFASQCAGAKNELDADMFKKLCAGNVSTSTIKDAFGLDSKSDCKFMQQILNSMQSSPFAQHPMMQSMGMGSGGKYDKKKFPSLDEGMPGFDMEKEGLAGGLECDFELPPCPFLSGSFEDLLKKCKEQVKQEEGGDEAKGKPKPSPDRKEKRKKQEREEEGG